MKKLLAALLVLCLAIGLCACGDKQTEQAVEPQAGETYTKVLFEDGTTELFAVGDLPAMVTADADTYNTKYAGNKIEMVTTITNVELDYEMLGFVRVTFEGTWNCYIRKGTPIIDELDRHLTVKVTGTMIKEASTIYGAEITVLN